MSDSNPDKPTPESEQERIRKIAASLPGEEVSREAAFPKKRQRPKARLPESVRSKIEKDTSEEAAKDKESDAAKAPPEKPKFKVTRSPFAPRIDQSAKAPAPDMEEDDSGWDDDDLVKPATPPAKPAAIQPEPEAKKPEPEIQKPEPEAKKPEPLAKPTEPAKPAPRPMPTKLEVTRAPSKEEQTPPKAQDKSAAQAETPKPAAPKPSAQESPKVVPIPKPAEGKPAAKEDQPAEAKPKITPIGKAQPSPTAPKPGGEPLKKGPTRLPGSKAGGPTKLPIPEKPEGEPVKPAAKKAASAPKPAARPKKAPVAARQQAAEEETDNVHIVWVAIDALTAVASIAFAFLVFTNMGG